MKKLRSNYGRAFTLIELMGVMAIIGILSAVVLPPMIAKIEDAQTTNEDANLEEIARALLEGIEREGRFPDPTAAATNSAGWVGIGSKYSTLGTNKFWKVYPNKTNETSRRVYLDQTLTNYLNGAYSMPVGGWTNTSRPVSPLIYIVSSSKPDHLLASSTNANLPQTQLDWLKNWVKAYETGGRIPATNINIVGFVDGSTNRWTNRGEFLHVKILNVSSLLCEVYLEDWHSPITNSIAIKPPTSDPTPTNAMNPFTTNGFKLSYTGSSWIFQDQPERNLADNFANNFVPGGGSLKNTMVVTYTNTNSPPDAKELQIRLPDSPSFSLNSSTSVAITDLSASPPRKDSTNFYALKGSVLVLKDNTPSANVQSTIQLKNNRHYHVFSSGVWTEKD